MRRVYAETALLPQGWQNNVLIAIDDQGFIDEVTYDLDVAVAMPDVIMSGRACIPGMANAHSHAFQRAAAGLTEHRICQDSSFWTWRQTVYRLANIISPDELYIVALQLYREMLQAGYTSVAEFHYLHNDPSGHAYSDPALLSRCLIAAAEEAGIALTLLPVFYAHSDFGGAEPLPEQDRFVHTLDTYDTLVETLISDTKHSGQVEIGIAPHSLRAATLEEIHAMAKSYRDKRQVGPIHIHIAEQRKEVEACQNLLGRRPVELMLDTGLIDASWCFVHATHILPEECENLARSGAVTALCITTEANLGDGFFPLRQYLDGGGRIAIGSDSNFHVSPTEEIRWMEYQCRLTHEERTVCTAPDVTSNGRNLYEITTAGGHVALGRKAGRILPGYKADLVFLDSDNPWLAGKSGDMVLDSWIFSSAENAVQDVMVNGKFTVKDARPISRNDSHSVFNSTLRALVNRL